MARTEPAPPFDIRVEAARLSYHGHPLFEDLHITLPAGSWTCLLGSSGVGKSSLLRLIAGLERTADMRIICDDGLPLAGRVAYMAQQDLLLPWADVLDNAMLGFRLRGESPPVERARALLDHVGLAGRHHDRPAALSGGMRQRVALVRTLLEDRPVILMDEPFSALDVVTRLRLQSLAAELLTGRTVLLVTHDPLEALRLSHRLHVMTGRPAQLGTPIEPAGAPPRAPADPSLLRLQAELLTRLTAGLEI